MLAMAQKARVPRRRFGWLEVLAILAVLAIVTLISWSFGVQEKRTRLETRRLAATSGSSSRDAANARTTAGLSGRGIGSREPTTSSIPPTQRVAADHVMNLPWRHAGQCVGAAAASRRRLRAEYLATFVAVPVWHTTLYVHPGVSTAPIAAVQDNLERVHGFATSKLGLSANPPNIYLYPSVQALRDHSCASSSAVAYYDGAIHLAVSEIGDQWELRHSLRHEYAHHLLVSNDIGSPIWLQEGAAMDIADEPLHQSHQLWRQNPLRMQQMVESFPNALLPEQAKIFYGQAYAMTRFLQQLCGLRIGCGLADLTKALKDGSATPETLFDWATSERGSDLVHTSPLPLWDDYVKRGNLAPATIDALLHRPDAN